MAVSDLDIGNALKTTISAVFSEVESSFNEKERSVKLLLLIRD